MKSMLRAYLAGRLQRIWYEKKKPPVFLRVLSIVYAALAEPKLHRPQRQPSCPVIVVGNLTVGGSGKTPVVAVLARHIQSLGLKPAIITRGYGGAEPGEPVLVSETARPGQVGDEARMLFQQTGLPVWTCKKRASALDQAIANGADVVISDDGLQHVALPRSFEICLIDQARGFGNAWVLPAGPLRQSAARLDSVDVKLYKQDPDQPLPDDGWSFRLESAGLRALNPEAAEPNLKAGDEVDAVAGIADPESFFALLEKQGLRVRCFALRDHETIDSDWLRALSGPVVMTAKDAARLDSTSIRSDLFVLDVEARLPAELLKKLTEHVRKFRP